MYCFRERYSRCKLGDNFREAIRKTSDTLRPSPLVQKDLEITTYMTNAATRTSTWIFSYRSISRRERQQQRDSDHLPYLGDDNPAVRLSWSHVFLGASVKHSSCFSRSCETLMQPQEAITAGTVCLCWQVLHPHPHPLPSCSHPKRISCTPHLRGAYYCSSHVGKITSHHKF